LTGTYQLDRSRSDDARDAADRATRNLPASSRQRIYDSLTARLEAPDQIAIDRRGRTVTIVSTRAPQITFDADGVQRVEQTSSGRSLRTRAILNGDQLNVSVLGDAYSEFNVTFDPAGDGRTLIVTRRVTTEGLSRPVVVQSTYNKTSDVAQLNIYSGTPNYPNYPTNTGTTSQTTGGGFIIPNGTTLVAVLNNNLTTKTSQENDRFTMTVRSPAQYEGATIEGYVTGLNRSGRITGRSQLTLNFDRIRMRDGRVYRFAGLIDNVRTTNGENVKVDNEGAVQQGGASQGTRTMERAAIGTAVGAIIGAIAGGGKGAAIGAVLGGGAGAGSVYVQGRDDLELSNGTEVTIRSTGPGGTSGY
jgi:hypothetical protein